MPSRDVRHSTATMEGARRLPGAMELASRFSVLPHALVVALRAAGRIDASRNNIEAGEMAHPVCFASKTKAARIKLPRTKATNPTICFIGGTISMVRCNPRKDRS